MHRLVLSTLLAAAPVLALACATTQTTGEQIDDAVITRRVEMNLATDSDASSLRTDVDVLNGVVTLSGQTSDPKERERAETVARSTSGVRGVINRIEVMPDDDLFDGNPDTWITTKVKAALAENSTTKAVDIDVDTDDRVVTLTGIVDSPEAKTQAVNVAKEVEGVREVVDRMKVEGAKGDMEKDGADDMDDDVDAPEMDADDENDMNQPEGN